MEEDIDDLCARAGELALLGVPMFLFQEGREPKAERTFKEIARLTRGAYCHFDAGSAGQLRELLAAVAVYATGGRKALARSWRGDQECRRGAASRAARLKSRQCHCFLPVLRLFSSSSLARACSQRPIRRSLPWFCGRASGVAALASLPLPIARGVLPLAIPLAFFGLALLGMKTRVVVRGRGTVRSADKSPGQKSEVRTDALEMALDHDSGHMEGRISRASSRAGPSPH